MIKNSRKAWVVFRRIMLVLFIVFLINYYQVQSGNYVSEENKRTILTEEKIREFEADVKNGDFVDIKDYTDNEYVDTSTSMTDLGYDIGEGVNDFINDKLIRIFEYVGKFFK